jgi:hypothetical protein
VNVCDWDCEWLCAPVGVSDCVPVGDGELWLCDTEWRYVRFLFTATLSLRPLSQTTKQGLKASAAASA